MPDPTTTNIVLAVPTRGSDVGTWDVPLNGDMTIIDACFGSVTTVALSNVSPVALTATQAQANVLRFTGTLSANVTVTIPAIIKGWTVDNQCVAGTFGVFLQNASGGQQIGIPPGEAIDVYSDGTNMKYRNLGRIGSYEDFGGASIPSWIASSTVPPYLLCDGSSFSSVTYPQLASILGTTTLPDFRGRQRIFLNGGTGRVTTANGGVDGNTRFASGGNPSLAISQPELPAYSPTFVGVAGAVTVVTDAVDILRNPGGFTVNPAGGVGGAGNPASGSQQTSRGTFTPAGTINALGSGTPHINMDPTCVGGITMIRAA